MTIKPLHLGNIRRGKKTFEVRKTAPFAMTPYRVLLCESGSGGMIKAEFICDYVRCIRIDEQGAPVLLDPVTLEACCLSMKEMKEYANGKELYCWHVTQMVDYCNTKGRSVRNVTEYGLKRPPQSWQYAKSMANECPNCYSELDVDIRACKRKCRNCGYEKTDPSLFYMKETLEAGYEPFVSERART